MGFHEHCDKRHPMRTGSERPIFQPLGADITAFHFPAVLALQSGMESKHPMKRAIELARAGMQRGDGGPFGAVVVRDGNIIGEGWNRVVGTNDPTAHGEIMAIRDACARLGGFSLEGCEIHTTGQPCPMCLGAIHWARIGRICYGFRVEDAAEIGFDDREFFHQMGLPEHERRIPAEECCRDEAMELVWEYARLPEKRPY